MTTPASMTNASAHWISKLGFKPQTPTNAVALAGTIFDRTLLGFPLCAEVIHNFVYTSAASDGTGIITCLTELYSSDDSAMAGETALKTKSVAITWVTPDAAGKTFHITMPVDLSAAKRYVRAKFTHTKAGTITVSAQVVAQTVRFSGFQTVPQSGFADAGYFAATDSAA